VFQFRGTAFGLGTGTLSAAEFWSNGTGLAHDANDRFIYNVTDDSLWFDADGTGAIAGILIADLTNDFALVRQDIVIV
jgi:Ca2+-binding RTX toxin-like protein